MKLSIEKRVQKAYNVKNTEKGMIFSNFELFLAKFGKFQLSVFHEFHLPGSFWIENNSGKFHLKKWSFFEEKGIHMTKKIRRKNN